MQFLELHDVEQITKLVADVCDPTVDVPDPDRKRQLAEGVCRLVHADVWIWVNSTFNVERSDVMATSMIDGGWLDAAERGRVYTTMTNPQINAAFAKALESVQQGRHLTYFREDVIDPDYWQKIQDIWLGGGLIHNLFSMYPVGPNCLSGVGFHRRTGKPNFTDRDRAIVHVIFSQVDWLHRFDTNVPVGEQVLQLPPRGRQVLLLLLGGNTKKQVAEILGISEFTVGDYMKQLHKHFSVNSRAELQAYFLRGGLPASSS